MKPLLYAVTMWLSIGVPGLRLAEPAANSVWLSLEAACAPLASAQIVATVEFTQVGWEWIYLASNPLPSGEPPLSYADCEGVVHALDWDRCGSVDVNDPHSPVVPTSFGTIKTWYR